MVNLSDFNALHFWAFRLSASREDAQGYSSKAGVNPYQEGCRAEDGNRTVR